MIEGVLAAEFDNKLGTCIVGTYPPRSHTDGDYILGDYLIPDGMHNSEKDQYVFRSVLAVDVSLMEEQVQQINDKKHQVNLYLFSQNDRIIFDSADLIPGSKFHFEIEIVQLKFLKFNYKKEETLRSKFFMFHQNLEIRKLSDKLYTIKSEDDSMYLIEFSTHEEGIKLNNLSLSLANNIHLKKSFNIENDGVILKGGWFYGMGSNKKDSSRDRGTNYRSLALFSSKINIFEYFRFPIASLMNWYTELPSKSSWNEDYEHQLKSKLESLYIELNEMVSTDQMNTLKIDNINILNPNIVKEITLKMQMGSQTMKVDSKIFNSSAKLLINTFDEYVMTIYRSLLNEKNIVFYGEKIKVEIIGKIVTSGVQLIMPLNIVDKIYPFEHVQSIDFLSKIKGFVAGFTNPIVKMPKVLNWDIFVNVNEGKVYGKDLLPLSPNVPNDIAFYKELVKKIKSDSLDVPDIDIIFYDYTKKNLDILLNKSSMINLGKESEETVNFIFEQSDAFKQTSFFDFIDMNLKNEREEFQNIYGKNYLGVFQAYKFFTESDKFDDVDIMLALKSLNNNLVQEDKIVFFIQKLVAKVESVESLTLGLLSEEQEVRRVTVKLINSLEKGVLWNEEINKLSIYKLMMINDISQEFQ